jgi:hypothetical protein
MWEINEVVANGTMQSMQEIKHARRTRRRKVKSDQARATEMQA